MRIFNILPKIANKTKKVKISIGELMYTETSYTIDNLIKAIKLQNKNLFNELEELETFTRVENVLTGIYLCIRFQKPLNYNKLRSFLDTITTITPKMQEPTNREELEQIADGLRAPNRGDAEQCKMVSENSEIYKKLVKITFQYAIQLKEEKLMSILVQDPQMFICSQILYILLKNEFYGIIKEIILDKLFISDDEDINLEEQEKDLKLIKRMNSTATAEPYTDLVIGDIITFMIQNQLPEYNISKFIESCKNLFDYSIIPSLLMNKREIQAEKLLKLQYAHNDQIVLTAIQNKCFTFLLFYMRISDNELIEEQEEIFDYILNALKDDPKNLEIYLFILRKYIKYFSLLFGIQLVNYITDCLHSNDSAINFTECHPNPIKISILFSELIIIIKGSFGSLKIKCVRLLEDLLDLTKQIQGQIDNEIQMRQIFLDKDVDNRDLLSIIGTNDLIPLLENPNMQSLITDIWVGPFIYEANLLTATSSLYKLLFFGGKGKRDFELKNRGKMFVRNIQSMKSHRYQFIAWKEGIQARYAVETLIFLLVFTMNIISTSRILQSIRVIYEHYKPIQDYLENDIPMSQHVIDILTDAINKAVTAYTMHDLLIQLFIYLLWHYIFTFSFLKLTKREISKKIFFQMEFLVDLMAVLIALIYSSNYTDKVETFRESHNNGDHIAVQSFHLITAINQYNYGLIISLIVLVNILRLFVAMRVNSIFGPFIKMIKLMIKCMLTFLTLYIINLLTFAAIGTIIMSPSKNNRFGTTYEAFITLFQASIGVFTFDDIEEGYLEEYYTYSFMIFFLLINMVLLMNFLIAILSNVYAIYENRSASLYMIEIIRMRKIYSSDDYYGCLISSPNPFSIITNPLPLFLFLVTFKLKNYKRIHYIINKIFLWIQYLIIFTIEFVFYILFNTILLPFVYLKWVVAKFILICKGSNNSAGHRLGESIIFLVFGVIILVCNYLSDLYYFCVHSYVNKPMHIQLTKKTDYITRQLYMKFLLFLEMNQQQDIVPYKTLSLKLKEICEIKDVNLLAPKIQSSFGSSPADNKVAQPPVIISQNKPKAQGSEFFTGIIKQAISNKVVKRQTTLKLNELFEGQESMNEGRKTLYLERILNFASISVLLKNICVKNKDGIEIISLKHLYNILFSYQKMEELQNRRKDLAKQSKKKLLQQGTYINQTTINEKEGMVENIEEISEVKKFLSGHLLMVLLHTYQLSQITKAIIFFKSANSQPLRIQALQRKINILGVMIQQKLRRKAKKQERRMIKEDPGELSDELSSYNKRNKLQERVQFQNEICGRTIYDEKIKWNEFEIRKESEKYKNEMKFSMSSEDISESHLASYNLEGELSMKSNKELMEEEHDSSNYELASNRDIDISHSNRVIIYKDRNDSNNI